MAGIDVGQGGRGGRRSVIADVQPIPMIDLMMVTIAFLLITAVWNHMTRLAASADAANDPPSAVTVDKNRKALHIEMTDERFALSWREGGEVLDRSEVARRREVQGDGATRAVRFSGLERGLAEAWAAHGVHREPTDAVLDRAVIHAPDTTPYDELAAVMDAVHGVERDVRAGGANVAGRAFEVVLAVQ